MKNKTPQQKLRETEPPQLGKDLEFVKDVSKMEIPDCTYMIPLRAVSYTHLTLPTSHCV